jgi:ATP-dependent DNA helicase RecG
MLGDPGSRPRNPSIANVFRDLHWAETKGSGIRIMREMMRNANLFPPRFESIVPPTDRFKVIFHFHHLISEKEIEWLSQFKDCHLSSEEAKALIFVRYMEYIRNVDFRSLNYVDILSASKSLRRLRDLNLLEMNGKGKNALYVPGSRLIKTDQSNSKTDQSNSKTDQSAETWLLPELVEKIKKLSKRSQPIDIQNLILALCQKRPLSATEIASLLSRKNKKYLVDQHLTPLLKKGELTHLYPDDPQHPQQKYTRPN